MKKITFLSLIISIIFSMGCQKNMIYKTNNNELKVDKLPYTLEEAIENEDIVNVHGDIINYEKLDEFIGNINNKVEDEIKIVHYTIEGDPIIVELKYDGSNLTYIYDNTRDRFGSPIRIEENYKSEDLYKNNLGYFIKAEEDILILEVPSQENILYNIKTIEERIFFYLEDRNIINDKEGFSSEICWVYEPTPENLIEDSNAIVKIKVKSEENPVFFNELDQRRPFTPYKVEVTEVLSGDLPLGELTIYNLGGIISVNQYINQISEEEAKVKGYFDLENKEDKFIKIEDEHFYKFRDDKEYLVILAKQENGIYTSFAGGYAIFVPVKNNDINYKNVITGEIYNFYTSIKDDKNTFIGVISEINENLAIVDVKEGDILSSSDKVIVDLSKNKDVIFEVGTEVKVKHSGIIRESYPAQIDTIEIDIIY